QRGKAHVYVVRIKTNSHKKGTKKHKKFCAFLCLLWLFPDFPYAGDGFSCGEMLGAGRTTPFDGTGVGFSFLGSTRGGVRRSSSGWPAISILISDASNDSRSSNASAIRTSASRFSLRMFFARS